MKKIVLSVATIAMMATAANAGKNTAPADTVIIEIPEEIIVVESSLYTAGFKLGTLGLGAELSIPLNNYFSVRASVNGLGYSKDDTYEDDGDEIAYDASVDLLTVGLLVDYYPMQSSQFRLTAGAYYNGNGVDAIMEPTQGTYEIDGNDFKSKYIDSMTADTEFDTVAPYIGMGWGNKGTEAGWGFSIDVGAMYHGEATLNTKVNPGEPIPTDGTVPYTFSDIEGALETETQDAQDDINDFQWYPVIMVGVTYTF